MNKEFLYAEEFCMDVMSSPFWAEDGEVIVDAGFVVKAGVDKEKTREAAALTGAVDIPGTGSGLLRWIETTGEDGKKYLAVANFGENTVCMKADTRNIKQIGWCGDEISLNSDSIHISGNSNSIHIPGNSGFFACFAQLSSQSGPSLATSVYCPTDTHNFTFSGI
jgi:hypothetical protein